MSSYYRMALENYLKELDVKEDSVLDIGGSAYSVKKRVKSWDVKNYQILDNNLEKGLKGKDDWIEPNILADLNFKIFEINNKLQEIGEGTFDMVFCLETFDYIWNPIVALNNIRYFLKDGGKAIVSFPFLYPVHEPKESDALRFTEFGIKKLCEVTGLKIVKMTPRKTGNFDLLWQFYSADKMHPARGYEFQDTIGWICELKKE